MMVAQVVDIISRTELSASIVSLRDDGLFQIQMKEIEREVEINDIKEMTNTIGEMGGGKKYPMLILIKRFNPITKDASEYAASEIAGRYTLADAIVINNFAIRIATNFYIKIFKPKRPTKMFNSEEKAVDWLKTFL